MKKVKNLLIILIVLSLMLTVSGCSEKSESEEITEDPVVENEENDNNEVTENEETNNDINEENDDEELEDISNDVNENIDVNLYFANLKYVETGDENLEKLIPETKTFTNDDNLVNNIMNSLLEGPENTEELTNIIPNSINEVFIDNDTVVVDFQEVNGGSLEETFTIEQIAKTYLQLNDINKVQFLVNGEITDSLMGHVDITAPIENVE